MSDHDPLGVRKYFPVVEEATFLASASVCPSPIPAVEVGLDFVRAKGGIPYDLDDMLDKCAEVRGQFGRLINAKQEEMGLIYTTSEAENIIVAALDLKPGDNIVTDDLHYSASYVIYEQLAKRGIEIRMTKREGLASKPADFEPLVDQNTRLLSVAWVSHQTGFYHDLRPLADLVHSVGGYIYADVIQGVGMVPLDVRAADLDFCAAGSYKWTLGNFGVANFFVRESLLPMFTPDRYGYFHVKQKLGKMEHIIHPDGRKFMYATPAFGSVYQLSAGLEFIEQVGINNIAKHVVGLAQYLRSGLARLGFDILTPEENGSAIVAFKHGADPVTVKKTLKQENVHVNFREADTQIRIGSALFNNTAELDRFLDVMGQFAPA
ncbi:MAG: aminotransferase class V-fold PLP-dependent enzyme [Chloroflexota bacterium]